MRKEISLGATRAEVAGAHRVGVGLGHRTRGWGVAFGRRVVATAVQHDVLAGRGLVFTVVLAHARGAVERRRLATVDIIFAGQLALVEVGAVDRGVVTRRDAFAGDMTLKTWGTVEFLRFAGVVACTIDLTVFTPTSTVALFRAGTPRRVGLVATHHAVGIRVARRTRVAVGGCGWVGI